MTQPVFTIGYSTDEPETVLARLAAHHVDVVADVRSQPYSRVNPGFARDAFSAALRRRGFKYVFLGDLLGARTSDASCYVAGQVQYARLARTAPFAAGLERLLKGAREHRIALLCAEKDPLRCHRAILVARELAARGARVEHIVGNALETHEAALERLLRELRLRQHDLFRSPADVAAEAYERRGREIAYRLPHPAPARLSP